MLGNSSETKKVQGRKFEIPVTQTIFSVRRNPLQDDPSVQQIVKKAYEFSLMSKDEYYGTKDVTVYTAHFHPFVTDLTKYSNLAWLMQLVFILDDHTECEWGDVARKRADSSEIWGQFYEMLDKVLEEDYLDITILEWKPYILAFFIALKDVCKSYSPDQMKRLIKTYRDYGSGNQKETELIGNGLRVSTYEQLFEVFIVFLLIEHRFKL